EEGETEAKPVTAYYRTVHRRMFSPSAERSLIMVLTPKGTGHINTVMGTAYKTFRMAVDFAGTCNALPMDFFVRSTGKTDAYETLIKQLPVISDGRIRARLLSLNCLTTHYADLWQTCWQPDFRQD